LFGKCGRRQYLRHQRIRIQRDGRHQLLQLLRSLMRVWRWRSLLALRRWGCPLIGEQVPRPSRAQQSQRYQGNQNPLAHSMS
jgi:hypothetical protein